MMQSYDDIFIRTMSFFRTKEWIDNHLLLEAQALLKSTNLTIQQIADTLHFTSQDVFSKYFKHHIGITPKEYRHNS